MTLDKRPDLTRRLRKVTDIDQGETRKTLVESTAESIQRAFTMCLTERSANRNGIGRDGKPEGKKIGIYSFANLALKLFFKVRGITRDVYMCLMRSTVPEDSILKSAFHQYLTAFTFPCAISCQSACHVPLLSWTLPLHQRPLLSRPVMSSICLRSMPCSMHQSKTEHTHLPHFR